MPTIQAFQLNKVSNSPNGATANCRWLTYASLASCNSEGLSPIGGLFSSPMGEVEIGQQPCLIEINDALLLRGAQGLLVGSSSNV